MGMYGHLLQITPKQLQNLLDEPYTIQDVIYIDDVEPVADTLDLNKDWHLLHYLITGYARVSSGPLANVILGGDSVGDVDVGHGPVAYLTPEEVRDISLALDRLFPAVLEKRFNVETLMLEEIYPCSWDQEDGFPEYLAGLYDELRNYYREATRKGNAMLMWIN